MELRAVLVVSFLLAAGAVPAAGTVSAGSQECSFPVSMVDTTGTEVTVEGEPERVVTLAPSAAQTMWEIGAKDKVVGVSKYASYLEGAAAKENVSGAQRIVVVEKVVALEPDLVIAPNVVPNDTIERLRGSGIAVYRFEEARTIEDIYRKVRTIGRLAGECEGAERTVAWMQERIGIVGEAVEGRERPDVLYTFFGYTAGEGTFIDEIIETAGGDNLAAAANVTGYRQISGEVVVEWDPDWIILNDNDPGVPKSAAFNSTTAVQEGRIVVIPIEQLNQPAPRVVYAITTLAEAFHPEAYAEANATATPTASPESATTAASATGTEPTPTGSPTSGTTATPGQPGFGVLPSLAALAAALLASRLTR